MTINWLAWITGMVVLIVLFFLMRDLLTRPSQAVPQGKYTFVLLVFNQEDQIEGLIRELRKLRSRYPAFELVVVDKGSTDRTAKMLEQLWRGKEDFRWTVLPEGRDKQELEFLLWNSEKI